MRLTYEKKIEETKQAKTTEPTSTQAVKTAKLKLVITKFRGDLTDWPRFWSQFETEIDKAEIAGVTKYSYLLKGTRGSEDTNGNRRLALFIRGIRACEEHPDKKVWPNKRGRERLRGKHHVFAYNWWNTASQNPRFLREASFQCAIVGNNGETARGEWIRADDYRQAARDKRGSCANRRFLARVEFPKVSG